MLLSTKALCKSRNGESGNRMRGMTRMLRIRVGTRGNKGGNVGNQGGNAGNQGGNLRIGVELMNQNCGAR